MSLSQDLGKQGETQAVDYLQSKGYSILERNWRYSHKELDIIAEYEDALHIVEVKTRSSAYWQKSNEVVSIVKQKNIIEATEAYLQIKNLDKPVVFDIVYILSTAQGVEIELIPDAFKGYEFI